MTVNFLMVIMASGILGLHVLWRHHFLKSKTKEPPKFLSSSGIRMGKLTFVYNFSAQCLASSGNQRILNFGTWHKDTSVFVEKFLLMSYFSAYSEVKVLGKALMYMLFCLVQIISHLDSQKKFQMFTLFFGHHVGVPRRYCTPTWQLHTGLCKFVQNISTNIWSLGKCTDLTLGPVSYNIKISWLYPLNSFGFIVILRDSASQELLVGVHAQRWRSWATWWPYSRK